MGRTAISSEEHVLKLVHPGKRIEIYTKPIQAAEILRKYPKFCITRPDVFKFPWIVVRSDSLLVPGKVFFLVPKRTLYRLLKANQPPDRSLIPLGPCTKNAGMTPRRLRVAGEDGGRRGRKRSDIEPRQPRSPWTVVGDKRSVRYSSSHVHDCYKCGGDVSSVEVPERNGEGKCKTTSLRSCMKKPGSAPRLVNPRVGFLIPGEDVAVPVTKQRTVLDRFKTCNLFNR
ncbi:hypothetical protein SDJN03_12472, partial [Cucurbita argyrosperma subsp. sororia]